MVSKVPVIRPKLQAEVDPPDQTTDRYRSQSIHIQFLVKSTIFHHNFRIFDQLCHGYFSITFHSSISIFPWNHYFPMASITLNPMVFIGFRDPPADPTTSPRVPVSSSWNWQTSRRHFSGPVHRRGSAAVPPWGQGGVFNSQKYGDLTSFTQKDIGVNRIRNSWARIGISPAKNRHFIDKHVILSARTLLQPAKRVI